MKAPGMHEYLGRNIKEIIQGYPAIAEVLEQHGIACVSCNVGTCRLRDIMEIHNLAAAQEQALMRRIAGVIFPGSQVEIPAIQRRPYSGTAALSPPLQKLVREHEQIKRLLRLIPALVEALGRKPSAARPWIAEGLEFIRRYADRFHHAKEEDVLFGYFDQSAEIFRVMRADHEQARGYVGRIQEALEGGDHGAAAAHLQAYRELLQEHIRREDEVLYPWINRNLSISQVGQLYSKFLDIEQRFAKQAANQEHFLHRLEEAYTAD